MRRMFFSGMIFLLVLALPGKAAGSQADEWLGELDFSEINRFLEDREDLPVSFEEIVYALFQGDALSYETAGAYIKDILLQGLSGQRQLCLSLFVVSLAFSILKNYAKNFGSSYIAEICFFLCYCFMMATLLKSFSVMHETVQSATETITDFMKVLVPAYCAAISFTLSLHSSAAAYSVIFTAVYVVEWLLRYFLMPLVQIYIMAEFLNHLMEEERFHHLSELIAGTVRMILKLAVTFILGLNLIQGMVAPAMDRLAGNSVAKTIQMVPGIGNVVNGMGQIFISSGIVIKNCVGAAGLIALLLLGGIPFLRMAVLAALYKLLAAVLEPIADKRLSGGMNGIANAGILYLRILAACLLLFFLVIALTGAASGLGMGG